MYAIIETGGKQYRVTTGEVLSLESLGGNVGDQISFDKVLLVGGQSDSSTLVGSPYVPNAKLQAEIVQQTRGEKILTIKYKRRKGYRRTMGHRQELTRILVTEISNGAGQSLKFDSAKRAEVLTKASVPFAQAKETKKAKVAKTASAAPKASKTTSKKPSTKKA